MVDCIIFACIWQVCRMWTYKKKYSRKKTDFRSIIYSQFVFQSIFIGFGYEPGSKENNDPDADQQYTK